MQDYTDRKGEKMTGERMSFPEGDADNSESLHGKLDEIIAEYFPDDSEFLGDFNDDDLLGYLYGQLIEIGEDPDKVFAKYNIVEI